MPLIPTANPFKNVFSTLFGQNAPAFHKVPSSASHIGTAWNGQLVECKLDGVGFPVIDVQQTVHHDIVQHKKPNVQGADIEDTGRNPITFHVKGAFINNLIRSRYETWDPGTLYPQTFAKVMNILLGTQKVKFEHPTLGTYLVNPVQASATLSSAQRNGQILEFELIEANQSGESRIISYLVNQGMDIQAGIGLDGLIPGVLVPQPDKVPDGFSFGDALQQLKAMIAQTTLAIDIAKSQADHILYQVGQVEDSLTALDQAVSHPLSPTTIALSQSLAYHAVAGLSQNPAQTANLRTFCTRVRSTCYNNIQGFANKQNFLTLKVYTVPTDTTVGALCTVLQNSLEDILKLNPSLASKTSVSIGTQVSYKQTSNAENIYAT